MSATPKITVYVLCPDDRPHYQVQWRDPATGQKVTRTARTAVLAEAEAFAADRQYELRHGLLPSSGRGAAPARLTWEELAARYDRLHLSTTSPIHRLNALLSLRLLARFAPRPAACTPATFAEVAALVRSRGRSAGTVAAHQLRGLAALRWAAAQGLLASAPAVRVEPPPPRAEWRTLDAAGYAKLRAACPCAAWRLLVDVAWYTGLRRGELLALTWGTPGTARVDLDAGRVVLPAACVKARRDQWVPVHPDLAALLRRVPKAGRAGPLVALGSGRQVSARFQALCDGAGGILAGLKLHDLRRSFGTRYAAVVPAQVLMRLMRHSDIKTTLCFYADLDGALAAAILKA